MSEQEPTPETRDCGGDAAAYALGALEPAEAEAFRQHLHTCIVCRDELAAFQQVIDVLPMTAPQYSPSRALRRRVLRAVKDESRLAEEAAPRRSRRPSLSWPSLPRPALALAAVLVVLVAGVAGAALSSSSSTSSRVIQASVGSAQLRVSGDRGELIVHKLPAPPAGRIYEVWLQQANGSLSPTNALFSVTSAGTGDVGVPGNLSRVRQVLVTQEPAGGSRAPTSAPVIVARLS